ncbi:hypothetical protein L0665_09980 [Methanogenium marinum]|uniref:Uncharacterized protein n=1 Tax=Methanogenium marinum TaxID=348610 RepID=A0A9Q4PWR1_9EURY|nr:hypothetical protein [Methanogenium marinum]MDE4908934.1 hypothetical protein [Methanogenium marinum]
MASGRIPCFILCAACICAALCGAGCLTTPNPQETASPALGDPVSLPYFQVAENDAEESLKKIIEEEIAESPKLFGYAVTAFYNGTSLEVTDCTSYHHDDGTPPVYVYTFRHTMPSLKDPQHMRDDVTLQITVMNGDVTERMVAMGSSVTMMGV